MDLMRQMQSNIPAQVVSVFFYVAAHEGCTMRSLEENLNMTQSSISRCTSWLDNYHRLGYPGLGLVYKQLAEDNKTKTVWLTDKGKILSRVIMETVYDD